MNFEQYMIRQNEILVDQLKQIKALLCSSNNLAIIKHPTTGEYIAISGTELNAQHVMDMIDPALKVSVVEGKELCGRYNITATDSSRSEESKYPNNPKALENDHIYVFYYCESPRLTYAECSQIAQCLHKSRAL